MILMKRLLPHSVIVTACALGVFLAPPASLANGTACAEKSVVAGAVRTLDDIRAFVKCAHEYAMENGTAETRRAFNEDARWKSLPIYVFVDELKPTGEESQVFVYPPDRSREGQFWGPLIDVYGNDYYRESDRIVRGRGEGWIYYSVPHPVTGREAPKSSYIMGLDWDGTPAVIGAGLYMRDLPGTCNPDEVTAAALEAEPGAERLQELVRCAAYRFEEAGYFAAFELQNNPRWRSGSIYLFVLNSRGMQYFSSNPVTINGVAVEEWNSSLFMERDVASPAAAFGESTLYYDALNPANGSVQRKVAFVKRVMVGGEALLVGSGYYLP